MEKFRAVKFPGDNEKKLKIYFSDYDKPYISNKSNLDTLARIMQSTKFTEWSVELLSNHQEHEGG